MAEHLSVLCRLDELIDGGAVRIRHGDADWAVVLLDGEVHAIGDRCSHAEASLSEGEVVPEDCALECPLHGAAFGLVDGEPLSLPAVRPVPTLAVRLDGDRVIVSATDGDKS